MHTAYRTPAVALTSRSSRDIASDLLVIPVFEDDDLSDEPELDSASGGDIAGARTRGEFKGKLYDLFLTPVRGWNTPRVALIGAGTRKGCSADTLRRLAITAGLAARQRRIARLAIVHRPGAPVSPEQAAQVLAEGAILANFEGASYQTVEQPRPWIEQVEIRVGGESAAVEKALERGRVLGECSNMSRALSNEPGNNLTPREFADRGARIARDAGLKVEVLDETRIAELRMGLLLGVARGSAEPPRMIVMRHEPKKAVDGVVLGLIGKGITFDTGGISIKPAAGMEDMKGDMAGAACVTGLMLALARRKAKVNAVGAIGLVENMPDGNASGRAISSPPCPGKRLPCSTPMPRAGWCWPMSSGMCRTASSRNSWSTSPP